MNLTFERLEYGKPCEYGDGPVEGGDRPSEYMRLGQTSGFPLGRQMGYGPESMGVNVPSVSIPPSVVEPHAILHAPYLLLANGQLRWTSYTLAQRWRPESAHTGRNYVIGRYLAQRTAPVAPSSLLATMLQEPLIGLTRGHRVDPMPLVAVQPAADWPPRFEVVDFLMTGIPVTVRMDAAGPNLATFVQMADSVYEALPTCLQPWFSWAWNARTGDIRGHTRPVSGALAFVASDQPLVASSAVVERREDGTWLVTPPTERRDAPIRAWSAWVARLGLPVCDVVPTMEFGRVDLFGNVGPARKASPHQDTYNQLLHAQTRRGEETRVDFAHLRLGEVYAEVGRQALRAWKVRDLEDALQHPERPFDLEWITTAGDHDRVLGLIDRCWARLDGVPTADPTWQLAIRTFDLQWEHARRARIARQEALWNERCTVVMQHTIGVKLVVAIDQLQTNKMSFERATAALHAWTEVPAAVREVLISGRDRGHGLVSRIHAALDVVADPWGRGAPIDAANAIHGLHAGSRATDFQHWIAGGPTGGVFRLFALYTHVARRDVRDLIGEWLIPGSHPHAILTRMPDPSTLEALAEGERRALARLCAAWLLEEDGVRGLGWGVAVSANEAMVHDWAWRVLVGARGLGLDVYAELRDAAWFQLVLGDGPVTAEGAAQALTPRVWESEWLFPPAWYAEGDPRISHALLAVWRHLRVPSTANARVARYAVHWPGNGMAQLLAPGSRVESVGPLQAPLPSYLFEDIQQLVGQADVAPFVGALWSLLETTLGNDAAGLRAVARGNLPVDALGMNAAYLLHDCFAASDPNDARCVSIRTQLAAPRSDHPLLALLSVVAALPPIVLGEVTPALLTRLFEGVRSGRQAPGEGMQRALEQHFWLHTLLFRARFMGLEGAAAEAVWRPSIRGTPAVLCFADFRPQDLPDHHVRYWRSAFRSESVVTMLLRFARKMELTAPEVVRETADELTSMVGDTELNVHFGHGSHASGPGSFKREQLGWLRKHWSTLRSDRVVQFGSWRALYRGPILMANYLLGGASLMWVFLEGARRVVAKVNALPTQKTKIGILDIGEWSIVDFTFAQEFWPMLILAILMLLVHIIVTEHPERYHLVVRRPHEQVQRGARHQIEVSSDMFDLLEILFRIRSRK